MAKAIQKLPLDEFKVKHFCFNWKIKNYSLHLLDVSEHITSPVFQVDMIDRADWELRLYPRSQGRYVKLDIIRKHNYEGPSTDIILKAFIVNTKVQERKRRDESGIRNGFMAMDDEKYEVNLLYLKHFQDEAEFFLPDDALTVCCQITNPWTTGSGVIHCTGFTDIPAQKYAITLPVFLSLPVDNYDYEQCVTVPLTPVLKTQPKFEVVLKASREDASVYLRVSAAVERFFGKCEVIFQDISCHKKELFTGSKWYDESDAYQIIHLNKKSDGEENTWATGFYELVCELITSNMERSLYIESTIYKPPTLMFALENISLNSADKRRKDNLKDMYIFGKFCNFTLSTQGHEFPVHKGILAATSKYFSRMFDKNAPNNDTIVASIDDVDPETLKRTLDFIYSEVIEELNMDTAMKLYYTAEKYQFEKLKERCAIYVRVCLSVDNICCVLAYGHRHGNAFLLKASIDFLKAHCREIFHSRVWKEFMENDLPAASQIMYRFCVKVSANHVDS